MTIWSYLWSLAEKSVPLLPFWYYIWKTSWFVKDTEDELRASQGSSSGHMLFGSCSGKETKREQQHYKQELSFLTFISLNKSRTFFENERLHMQWLCPLFSQKTWHRVETCTHQPDESTWRTEAWRCCSSSWQAIDHRYSLVSLLRMTLI